MDDFSSVEDEQFVHLVSQHAEIFDAKNKNYINTTKKEFIWQEIAKQLNKSGKYFKSNIFFAIEMSTITNYKNYLSCQLTAPSPVK